MGVSLPKFMGGLRSNTAFTRLFLGRIVTNAGDSMYAIAAMWLVYDLTGSPFYTGLASFLVRVPTALQFLVGPLVDRWPLRSLLVGTQLIQGLCVLAVPIAAAVDLLSVWLVLLVMPLLTFLNQFVYPAQQATLPRILDDDELIRANSLFSFAYQGLNMVFNAASGVLIAVIGAVALYLVNAATFAVAVVLFLGLKIPDVAQSADGGDESDETEGAESTDSTESTEESDDDNYFVRLREGLSYVRGSVLRALIFGGIIVNFAYGVMIAVLPAFAATRGGAEAYGLFMAAMAAGNLVGAMAAPVVDDYPFGWITIVGYVLSAVCWIGVLTVTWFPASIVLFFCTFVPIGAANVVLHSMIQSTVHDSLLGRVSSVNASLSTVTLPVGSLLGGTLATTLGSATVMSGLAIALLSLSVYFLVRPKLRTLPPVGEADESILDFDKNI
ncbi:MFS transporter [Haladaptatus cibarius]|uniref:MFS transporter n=1 Tax=Haladaptatus cibarius TaxID=453847 RepID=UPI000678D71D|nr:MFS transporter [Haladaptatus cibarius]